MRDSTIFYRSFYEAIKHLPDTEQAAMFRAIFDYSLDGVEPELSGVSKTIFLLMKPQIEANNRRFANGKKGGRNKAKKNQTETKTEPKSNQTETKTVANNNVNVNNNNNGNENDNFNSRYPITDELKAIIKEYGRPDTVDSEIVYYWNMMDITKKHLFKQGMERYKNYQPDPKFRVKLKTFISEQMYLRDFKIETTQAGDKNKPTTSLSGPKR